MQKFIFRLVLLLVLYSAAYAQETKEVMFTEEVAEKLAVDLFTAVNPLRPDNAYMPPFLKEKLLWISEESAAGRLKVVLVTGDPNEMPEISHPSLLMGSTYHTEGLPVIFVMLRRLFEIVRVEDRTPTGYTRGQKNMFAISLAHEAVHLEQPRRFFAVKWTTEQQIREELRAWTKTDEQVVSKLLEMNEPVRHTFARFHKIRKACGKRQNCPAIREFLSLYPSKTNH